MKNLRQLKKYIYTYKWHLLLGIVFVFLSNYFRVLQPQIIRNALDLVVENLKKYNNTIDPKVKSDILSSVSTSIFHFGLIVIGLAILMGLFMYFMRQTIIVMSRLIEYDMHKELFEHYQKLSLAFYKRNNTGDLMSRITEDVSKVRMAIGPAILYGINLVSIFVLVIYSMLKVSPILTFYSLAPLPVLSIIIYFVSNMINKRSEIIQQQLAVLNSTSQEVYSGIRVVKSFVQEKPMLNYFKGQTENYRKSSLDLAKIDAYFFPVMALLVGASTILTVYVGGLQVIAGKITTGNIAEFVIYVNMLTWPVTAIGWIASLVQRAEASQKRINEFMHEVPEIRNPLIKPHLIEGEVAFKNVSFTYPVTNITAIKDINFELNPGSKIAIVGRTGCGKSTIADLLLRMYDVSEGQILIDEEDIRTLDLANLRRRIGYVPQDVFLFSDSIYNNIRFGSETTDSEIEQMAKNVSVYEDIMGLPEQFETIVGERGVTLSGGQKQRIAIARALIKDPDIVILDDCLSAVDANTEKQILEFLNQYLSERSAIIITHRIFTLLSFDQILVMKEGRIVEQGNHEKLLSLGGMYKEMFDQQLKETDNL